MIKQVETPFLKAEVKDEKCIITGSGNTWYLLLIFAHIVKAAKEGQFTDGFANKGAEKGFIRILNTVYKYPDDAIAALVEGDYLDGE